MPHVVIIYVRCLLDVFQCLSLAQWHQSITQFHGLTQLELSTLYPCFCLLNAVTHSKVRVKLVAKHALGSDMISALLACCLLVSKLGKVASINNAVPWAHPIGAVHALTLLLHVQTQ